MLTYMNWVDHRCLNDKEENKHFTNIIIQCGYFGNSRSLGRNYCNNNFIYL